MNNEENETEKINRLADGKPEKAKKKKEIKPPLIKKPVRIEIERHDYFLKVCYSNFQDFNKRVNFLIENDNIEHKRKQSKPPGTD